MNTRFFPENKTKKNLVFFSETRYIGGAEVYLLLLATSLDKKLFNIRVAIPKSKGIEEFVNELRSKGIKVDFIKKYNVLNNFLYFNKIKPDYIHFNVPMLSITTCTTPILAAIMYSRSKLYVTEHMVPPEYKPPSFIRSIIISITGIIIRLLYTKLDMSITVSNKNKEILIKNFKFPKNKIKVIYNCIDIEHITNYDRAIARELKSQFSIDDSAIVFGTVGRLNPQKGHEYLINASKNVIKEVPQSLFLFVGRGENKEQLIQKIKENNISEYFRFAGYQEHLSEIFALIDIFVLPSISEGFPFVVLEAMAANKPVIATNVGGVPEIITNNVNGILVEPMDSDALARAMIMLAKDTKKRNHIAEMGCKRIRENFSLEKMILATKETYK